MNNRLFRKKSIPKILADAKAGYGDSDTHSLNKILGVRDLTFLGIAAVIGAGVFSSIGKACFDGGPGVIFLYIFTAIACGFAALCYAQFASTVPVSGSAYTYSYVAFGEIIAWIIGWDLLMEYAIGNIAVAISWSDYFTHFMGNMGVHFPAWMCMDYMSAHAGYLEATKLIATGANTFATLDASLLDKYNAFANAPNIGSFHFIFDIPAFAIVALITAVVFVGIRESRSLSNIMVIIKLLVIFLVIVVGGYYVDTANWSPFNPNGASGILKGVSAVFFAYIGFDAISTTAEECKDPQRDLPRGMIYSLIICTILYVLLALVLTGMISYTKLNVGDPLALIFENKGMHWIAGIVALSALFATASVLLVFQMGQPRIWMSMSRDGLLPKIFSRIHPKYKTPSFSTIITGLFVAVPALFLNLDTVISLTSIGTLFAFVLVCGGILVLNQMPNAPESKFKVPAINGKLIVPAMMVLAIGIIIYFYPTYFKELFVKNGAYNLDGLPMILFWIVAIIVAVYSYVKNFSLIPVLGLISCFYLMAQETSLIWLRFLIWLVIGLVIYFLYGYSHSKLNDEVSPTPSQE
jgi:basic amino acid/polyamine antiporter, APA family